MPMPRSSMTTALRRPLLLVAACVGLAAAAAVPARAQMVLEGQVLDDVTGEPVPAARVWLLNRYNRVSDYVVADEDGRFRFERSGTGWYRLDIRAVGYQGVVTAPLWMLERRAAGVNVRLSPHAVLLAPLEVVALSPLGPSPVLENMLARRQSGLSHQITRQQIEERRPVVITDMLMEIPGVYAAGVSGRTSGRSLYMARTVAQRGGRECPVQVFVDGMLATRGGLGAEVLIDDLVHPLDVEAIEVFRGLGSIPPEFLTPDARCGVIAIWTRRSLP